MAALTAPSSSPSSAPASSRFLPAPSLWADSAHDLALSALTSTAMLPPLTEQGDALTVARGRMRALHARLTRAASGGAAAAAAVKEDADAAKIDQCERAFTLFDAVDAATSDLDGTPSASAEKLVEVANEKGQALVKALSALGLDELRDGGPVSLPRPKSMADGIAVHFAQINWEADEDESGETDNQKVRWTDDATLGWVRFGILHGHNTPGLMPAALCLLARVERSPTALFEGGKSSLDALDLLKAAASFRLDEIASGAVDPNAGDVANASVVWDAVNESRSMADMSAMFDLYRDPTSDEPHGEDDDEDYNPAEEGPLFMEPYAACDECGADLYLPGDQTCPGMGEACGGLLPFVITPEQTTDEESFACDTCSKICPEGEQMRGCRDCEFDLCETCSGPWYHEMAGGRDFCGKHWAAADDKELFILVTAPEDLGSQMDDYFGDDGGEGDMGDEEAGVVDGVGKACNNS